MNESKKTQAAKSGRELQTWWVFHCENTIDGRMWLAECRSRAEAEAERITYGKCWKCGQITKIRVPVV